ncbi:hypothetical protein V9L05_00325 [Bernardetia sp. Wsw4-3y2]|uniref:hypothetical protein n=1 Tax=Bernardetia sp. Wsw4-3y2 TaxID=3127471 RepID=UPI0030D0769C
MNIHKIDPHLHHSFLEEERKDAITGDLIQANDEVVFCGVCKSAFQKDSWEYMDRKHCGQTKTLKNVPISMPLLLNVRTINPHFITLTNSSTSFKKCLKLLSSFKAKDKKVDIALNSILKRGTEEYEKLTKRAIKKIDRKIGQERKIKESRNCLYPNKEEEENIGDLIRTRTILISSLVSTIFIFLIPDAYAFARFPFLISIFILILLSFEKIKSLIKKEIKKRKEITRKKQISLGNFESMFEFKYSITFGIFNHNLFLYFEELKQAIFVELTRVSKIEIRYKSHCYILLTLKSYKRAKKEIEIPLVFSKNSEVTEFLVKLASSNKEIANPSNIMITSFPANQKKTLQSSLKFYPNITFIENEYSQNK